MAPKMTLVDEFVLGPIEKWRRFRKPPWKLTLHVLLTVLLSTYCVLLNHETAVLSRLTNAEWENFLYPPDAKLYRGDERDYFGATYFVSDVASFRADAQRLIKAYFDLPSLALDTYVVHEHATDDVPAPIVTLETYDERGVGDTTTRTFRIANASQVTTLLPWDTDTLQALRRLHIQLQARSADVEMSTIKRWRCLQWRIDVEYSTVAGRQLEATLNSFPQRCPNTGSTTTALLATAVAAAVVAAVYQVLVTKAACRNVAVLTELRAAVRNRAAARHRVRTVKRAKSPLRARSARRARATTAEVAPLFAFPSASASPGGGGDSTPLVIAAPSAQGASPAISGGQMAAAGSGEAEAAAEAGAVAGLRLGVKRRMRRHHGTRLRDLSRSDAAHLLNVWVVVSSAASVAAIWFAVAEMLHAVQAHGADDAYAPVTWRRQRFMLGMGTGMAWIGVLQYLEFNAELYILIRTMNRAMPRVGKYMAAVFPIFFGYTFFGVVLFGDAVLRFGNVRDTAITLFAVLNGDSIRETFTIVLQHREGTAMALLTYIYLYSFCLWFIYLVLMCFVAIVEEAFFAAREYAITKPKAQRTLPPHLHVLLGGSDTAHPRSDTVDGTARRRDAGGPLAALAATATT